MDHVGGGDGVMEVEVEPRYPIQLLPDEMWLETFALLKDDPRDVLNLADTCTQFENLLQITDNLSACPLEEVIPIILQWLKIKDILNCRGICKRLRKTVDKVLDHLDLLLPYHNLNLFPRLKPPHSSSSSQTFEMRHFSKMPKFGTQLFSSVPKIDDFRRDIEEKRVSTVVAKSLVLSIEYNEDIPHQMDPPDLVDKLMAVLSLDMMRKQVQNLIFFGPEDPNMDGPIQNYDLICRLVAALPNLKTMELWDFPALFNSGAEVAAILERYIANGHPFPAVPLESWYIDQSNLPMPLFREIVGQCSGTLRDLTINLQTEDVPGFQWDQDYHFPALVNLEISSPHFRWHPHWHAMLVRIHAPQLKQLRWPNGSSPIATMLGLVQQFPSLVNLQLSSGYGNQRAPDDLEQLWGNLSHLGMKRLDLKGHYGFVPLQFFGAVFPNLESIHMDPEYDIYTRSLAEFDPDVRLCSEKRMERSALWSQLPKLKTFRMDSYQCTRTEAEAFQNGGDF